ncbi:pectin lyase fold/virulence factor [Leptodontidium sp. 2 PMI_412]|nr:pectin lyase fold/virulence factor [Leptodontidium sp. 2 PMI_412]
MPFLESTIFALLASASVLSSVLASPASLEKRAVSRTSPPSGCLVVRGSGTQTGEYATVSSAVAVLSSTASSCIFIYPGTYAEVVYIKNKGPLTIYGSTTDTGNWKANTVTITHGVGSYDAGSLDASSAMNVVSNDVKIYNINFENTYGTAGQAVALTANGERQGYYGCSFKSYQDTLYAKSGYQYYSNCYIEGAVDYIFGDASAWFGECTIASSGGGSITASSRTYDTDPSWYVIDHSTITAASGASVTGLVYLGRPWRVYARVIYQFSALTAVVNAKGWAPMTANATPIFEEWSNTGASSSTSSRLYYTEATAPVTKGQLWPLGYSWIDTSY